MLTREQVKAALAISLIYFLILPKPAHAYLDPGSGSLIWQLLIAAILSISVVIGSYWRKIRRFLKGDQAGPVVDPDIDPDVEPEEDRE